MYLKSGSQLHKTLYFNLNSCINVKEKIIQPHICEFVNNSFIMFVVIFFCRESYLDQTPLRNTVI